MYSYCLLCGVTVLFQMRDLFAFRIPKSGIRILLPVCPSPGLVCQFFPEEPVSRRPVPLWQLLGVPAAICPWLSSSAWGLQDASATAAQGLRFLFRQCVGRDFPPPIISFLFCFVCVFVVVVQFTHTRTVMLDCPSPQHLSDPSYKETFRANKKQTM